MPDRHSSAGRRSTGNLGVTSKTSAPKIPARRCGLCGKAKKLTRTECCGQWICNDAVHERDAAPAAGQRPVIPRTGR